MSGKEADGVNLWELVGVYEFHFLTRRDTIFLFVFQLELTTYGLLYHNVADGAGQLEQ